MAYKRHTYKKKGKSARSKSSRRYRGGEPPLETKEPEVKLPQPEESNNASTIISNVVEETEPEPEPEANNEFRNSAELNQEPPKPEPEITEITGNQETDTTWSIITSANPEFQAAVSTAPYLKNIKPTIADYHFQYLVQVLRDFSYADSHKAYTNASKADWCYVFVLSQMTEWLQKEIQNIQTTKESKDYAFTTKDSEIIIAELQAYIDYFTRNATTWDRLNTQFLEVLFDGIRD
jgi:hypothetical protein